MFNKFVNFLQAEMPTPTLYGWFHLFCVGITIGLAIFLGIKFRNASEHSVRKFLIVTSMILIFFELYKQLIFSYSYDADYVWDYQWYAFPFQFCSTPMYVCLLAGLLKKGKIQNALFSFLGTYALLGGLLVMSMPGDVFMSFIGINIQTMVHHGAMIVIAVVLYSSKSIKLDHKTIINALLVFLVLISIALMGNCIYYWVSGVETFNLFYISPYYPSTLPVFDIIYTKVPYIVFLMLYVVGFTIAAYIMLLVVMLINKLLHLKNNKVLN